MKLKTVPIFLAFLAMGFGDAVGPFVGLAREHFQLTNFMATLIQFVGFIMFFFLSIPMGIYQDKKGKKHVLLLGLFVALLGLIIPILLPILISLLLVVLFQVPMVGDDWIRLILLIGVSLLYITFFILFGLFVSSLSSRSSVSFLFSLVFWIAFVLIIPRAGVVAAGHIVPVPSLGEVEGTRDAYAKNKWEEYFRNKI